MRAAMRVKGASLPVSESFDKTHSSEAGHQIHLARGDQTADDGIHRNTVRGETHVIFFEQLRYWIVPGNIEHDRVCAGCRDGNSRGCGFNMGQDLSGI